MSISGRLRGVASTAESPKNANNSVKKQKIWNRRRIALLGPVELFSEKNGCKKSHDKVPLNDSITSLCPHLPPHGDVEGDVQIGFITARVELHIS